MVCFCTNRQSINRFYWSYLNMNKGKRDFQKNYITVHACKNIQENWILKQICAVDDDIKRWRKHLFVTHTSLPLSTHRQESWESNNNNIINCNTRGATLLAFILSPDIISRCSCDIIRRRKAVTTTTAPTTHALSRLSTSSYFSCWIFDAFRSSIEQL